MKSRQGVNVDNTIIEKLKADFFVDDFKAVQPYPIYRINQKGMRVYVKVFDDNTYIYGAGVTSILEKVMSQGYFLDEWKITKTAQYGANYTDWYLENSANYGTYYHVLCGQLLKKNKIDLNSDVFFKNMEMFYDEHRYDFKEGMKWYFHAKRNYKKEILSFVKWVQDYNVKPIAMEYQFVTKLDVSNNVSIEKNVYYSGSLDLICKLTIKGVEYIALVDFKTSKSFYPSNEAQLHLYAKAWNNEDLHAVIEGFKVERMFNFAPKYWKKKPTYLFKDQTESIEKDNVLLYLDVFNNVSQIDLSPKKEIADYNISIESNIEDIIIEVDPISEILEDGKNANENQKKE